MPLMHVRCSPGVLHAPQLVISACLPVRVWDQGLVGNAQEEQLGRGVRSQAILNRAVECLHGNMGGFVNFLKPRLVTCSHTTSQGSTQPQQRTLLHQLCPAFSTQRSLHRRDQATAQVHTCSAWAKAAVPLPPPYTAMSCSMPRPPRSMPM